MFLLVSSILIYTNYLGEWNGLAMWSKVDQVRLSSDEKNNCYMTPGQEPQTPTRYFNAVVMKAFHVGPGWLENMKVTLFPLVIAFLTMVFITVLISTGEQWDERHGIYLEMIFFLLAES